MERHPVAINPQYIFNLEPTPIPSCLVKSKTSKGCRKRKREEKGRQSRNTI
uniref:Uncharacterized protein n=1 Tax=Solanum lycopersicum TaxID=4081 RepID=A0A3Q7GEV1_SOLLC